LTLRLGTREIDSADPRVATELRDGSALLGDARALRERLEDDGYLLLRGFHPRDQVLRARRAIVEHLAAAGALAPGSAPDDAIAAASAAPPNMKGRREITHHPAVQAILEGPRVMTLFAQLFDEPARSFDYKWLRATPPGEFPGVHADSVYMGRGSPRLLSCWVPFGEVTPAMGAIALCVGSVRSPDFARVRETYGRSDSDRDGYGGWLTLEPLELSERAGARWATTTFAPGDVLIFGMQMLHASFVNITDRHRLSCDVRFQPAAEPVDERWVGDGALAAKSDPGPRVATPAMRAAWGI
jgi:hypothetical protein